MSAPDLDRVQDDLRYVRSVVDEADRAGGPAAVYWLWAAISLVGFSLIDLRPRAVPVFWAVAGPLGGIASFWLGWRSSRRLGQDRPGEGLQHVLHWTGMMAAIGLVLLLPAAGLLPPDGIPTLILLVVALGYWTAGAYLDRKMLYVGAVMAAGYLASLAAAGRPGTWILTGVMISASLAISGWLARSAWRRAAAGGGP